MGFRFTADEQELVTLRYGGGLNIVELALVLGLPIGTVKRRLHDTRARLRDMLEGSES